MTQVMVEYAYNTNDRHDPRWYENQPDMCDPRKATVWALHLHVEPTDKDKILEVVGEFADRATGEYTYGDSWREWGEVTEDDDNRHMVVYFKAAPDEADAVGYSILSFIPGPGGPSDFCVTTAGDYAEQAL